MGKRIWLMGLLFVLGIIVGLGATTVFAQEPPKQNNPAVSEMQQACLSGDYNTMIQLHNQYCGGQNGMMSGNWTAGAAGPGGMMRNWQNGAAGFGGMMRNWWGGGNNQQNVSGYGGMMGGRGMMGGW